MINIFKCITLLNYKRVTCKQEIPSRTGIFACNRSYPSLLTRKKVDLKNTVELLAFWFMTIMRNLTASTGLFRVEIEFNFSLSWLINCVQSCQSGVRKCLVCEWSMVSIPLECDSPIKTLFTWSGGPRSSGVSFFCFVSHRAWKQKKPTPLDLGPPLHVNRP